jgi:hypothetical protein
LPQSIPVVMFAKVSNNAKVPIMGTFGFPVELVEVAPRENP